MKDSTVTYGGAGVCGLLGIAFIILRLCGVIDWSWWWVTAPFWGPLAIVVVILVACIVFAGVHSFFKRRRIRRSQ